MLYSLSRACPGPKRLLPHCDGHAPGYIHRKGAGGATGRFTINIKTRKSTGKSSVKCYLDVECVWLACWTVWVSESRWKAVCWTESGHCFCGVGEPSCGQLRMTADPQPPAVWACAPPGGACHLYSTGGSTGMLTSPCFNSFMYL